MRVITLNKDLSSLVYLHTKHQPLFCHISFLCTRFSKPSYICLCWKEGEG